MESGLVPVPIVVVAVSALAAAAVVRRGVLAWAWVLGSYTTTALLFGMLRAMGAAPDLRLELWISLWAMLSPLIALRGAGWAVETRPRV